MCAGEALTLLVTRTTGCPRTSSARVGAFSLTAGGGAGDKSGKGAAQSFHSSVGLAAGCRGGAEKGELGGRKSVSRPDAGWESSETPAPSTSSAEKKNLS